MKSKRLLSMIVALGLALSALSGCESRKGDHGLNPKTPITLNLWHYYNGVQQEQFDKLLLEFNETLGNELGIVVEGHNKNGINDLASSVLASLRQDEGAEEAPDMFAAYAGTAYQADQLGCVADLSKYFTERELNEYVEGYLEEGNIDGSGGLKIFPIAKSTEVLMLNLTDWRDFSKKMNVSEDDLSTWEGVAKTAEKYYAYTDALTPDVPNDGRAFFGRDAVANYMIIGAKQLGLEFFTPENGGLSMHADKDTVRRLWDCYYVPYVKGFYLSHGRYRSDDAQVGEIIAMVCSTTGSIYFPQSVTLDDEHVYPIESLVLPVPNFEGTDPYVVQQGAGMVVVKSDEVKEYACSVFLKWFTEADRSIAFSTASAYLPVKKAAYAPDAISAGFESEESILYKVMEVAVSEINDYQLYASRPYDTAEDVRDFLEKYIQDTAQTAHDAAAARIASGENRDGVLSEYVSDQAFDAWYEDFLSGLRNAAGV